MEMEKIELRNAVIENRDGIIWILIKEDADLTEEDIKDYAVAAEKLSGGKPYLQLTDARVNLDITTEGRRAAAKKEVAPLLVAHAILVNNAGVRLIANFFIAMDKPHFENKVFNTESEALKWLKKQA